MRRLVFLILVSALFTVSVHAGKVPRAIYGAANGYNLLGAPFKAIVSPSPSCPTITKSLFASQAITSNAATLHFHTDYAAHAGFRYHLTGANPWAYRHDADTDSLEHTKVLAGLTAASTYVWQSNTKYTGCDSVAYGDSMQFKTGCTTVATSNFATQAITTTGATLHFHTDITAHAHYRYALYGSSSYTYLHDADADSVQHTKAIAGLTLNHTQYKWQVAIVCATDSTAYGDQQDFYTACTAITESSERACNQGGTNAFTLTTSRSCRVGVEWKIAGGSYEEIAIEEVAGTVHWFYPGSYEPSSSYTWKWRYINECGTTSAYAGTFTGLTDGDGYFPNCP